MFVLQSTSHLTDTPLKTTLTAFFDLFKTCPLAITLLHYEVPRHFRRDASQMVWQIRKKDVPLADFSGYVTDNDLRRVYTVHPNNIELFRMRLLFHHVRGPISFEALKTVIVRDEDGVILLKLNHAAHTLRHGKSWDCWKIILIGTR
ncbi:hypothetical protein TNCV_4064121 [Trichonephila clavipes]|nr:hypothetical protein TNCV_4064121 [Trichonephila clavipes]